MRDLHPLNPFLSWQPPAYGPPSANPVSDATCSVLLSREVTAEDRQSGLAALYRSLGQDNVRKPRRCQLCCIAQEAAT
ncbi:hypothetical protein [Methylobacterium fujisawaense]|uniref:hypothetical protein n=1 Tax=Methylobacterium fujisawaense TaxID=107400 RepID=UPI00313F0A7E